jgi:hypothetical protein
VISFIIHFNQWDALGPKQAFRQACEYLGGASDADPVEIERQRKENERKRAEQDAADAAALLARRKQFHERAAWKTYHAQLDTLTYEHDGAPVSVRQLWREAGVSDNWQDYWGLGYTPDLWAKPDRPGLGPALVIPYRTLDGRVVTAQYRFRHVNGRGKYIFHPHLGAVAFIARHDLPFDQVLVVEGAKKAAVAHVQGTQARVQVIGMPSENNVGGKEIEEKLVNARRIWWWPDPGSKACAWAIKHIQRLGLQGKTQLVRFSQKVDDALLSDLSAQGFQALLISSRLVATTERSKAKR